MENPLDKVMQQIMAKLHGLPAPKPGQTKADYMKKPTVEHLAQAIVQQSPDYPNTGYGVFKNPEDPFSFVIAFGPAVTEGHVDSLLRVRVDELTKEDVERLDSVARLFDELEDLD